MIPFKLANANASVITVTTTAATLLSLIDAAASSTHVFPPSLDGVDLVAENGDVRVLCDGNTPTTSKGILVKQGATLYLRRIDLVNIRLIATTGSVSCSLQIGQAQPSDISALTGGGGAITSIVPGTGATSLGKPEDGAHTSGDTGVMALAVANEAQTNLSGTDGDYTPIGTNRKGTVYGQETLAPGYEDNSNAVAAIAYRVIAGSTYAPTQFANFGANATLNIKASAGNLLGFYAYQTNGSARFEQYHNTATTPSGGAVPLVSVLVPASGAVSLGTETFTLAGWYFSNGIAFAHSTTFGTYTAGTAADGNRFGSYK